MKARNNIIIGLLCILSLFVVSCDVLENKEHDHDTTETTGAMDEPSDQEEEGDIHLTLSQIDAMSITYGNFSSLKINDLVNATGTLGLPPNAYSSVNAKASGYIRNSNKYIEGSYVRKGETMAYLENPDFIRHQQEYLETQAELTFLGQELDRQEKLFEANAGVEKNLQKLQSDVSMKTATLKGIERRLKYLGMDVTGLIPNNIVEQVAIIAPMSGYITSIQMHDGIYVTPELELMEIVNENHLHLELDVFENDIANLQEGQKITYTVPALGNTVYDGEVHVIGKEFNVENKTVRVHGHLEGERPRFIKDLFIEAKIWLSDRTVQALPESAIIRDGASSYIYLTDGHEIDEEVMFKKMMVIPGVTDNGFTAVRLINQIPEGVQIVVDGAYYVYAQSKAGELEHEH